MMPSTLFFTKTVEVTKFRVSGVVITAKSVKEILDEIEEEGGECKLSEINYGIYNIYPHNKIRSDGRLEIPADAVQAYNLYSRAPTQIKVKVKITCQDLTQICIYGIVVDEKDHNHYATIDETCFCVDEKVNENEVYNYVSSILDGYKLIKPFGSDVDKINVGFTPADECLEIVEDWQTRIKEIFSGLTWSTWRGSHHGQAVRAEYGEREEYKRRIEEFEDEV